MAAVDYSGIRDQIKSILEGDTRTAGARVYVEEEPEFGLQDVQQAILVYADRRTADGPDQTLSAGKRTRYKLQIILVVAYFSMDSFKVACDGRDAMLGSMELVLMANHTLGGKATTSWLTGGELYSVRGTGGSPYIAVAETTLVVDVTAVG